jgi:hypothetical protein
MKKILLFALGLSLQACNCSAEKTVGAEPNSSAKQKVAAIMALLPADEAALAIAIHDPASALVGAKAQVDRIAGVIDDPVRVQTALRERIGFDIFDAAAWKSAGLDLTPGIGLWFGGKGGSADWVSLVSLKLSDKKLVLATAKRLATREGAMDLGAPVAHDGGEWIPFERTFGQKRMVAGGLYIKGDRVVFTSADKDSLDRLKDGTKRLDSEALYQELVGKISGLGHGLIFGTQKIVTSQAEASDDALKLAGSGWLASFKAGLLKLEMNSISKAEGEALANLKKIMPKSLSVPGVPAKSILAWQQSTDPAAVIQTFAKTPQVAQGLKRMKEALAQQNLDLQKDVLGPLGTTFSLWLGTGKAPTSVLTLLAGAFVGLDIAGGDPQALIDTLKKVVETSGAPLPGLTGLPNGFDFQSEMGTLKIRADKSSKTLSLRFGQVPTETLVTQRPQAKAINLDGDRQSAVWIDFKGLAAALNAGAALAQSSPVGPMVGKVAAGLAQYDYLLLTGGLSGAYQTGHGELTMSAAAKP